MLPKPNLFGWTRAWPPDDRATQAADAGREDPERMYDGEDALPASAWYETEPLRRLLSTKDLPMTSKRLQAQLGERADGMVRQLAGAGFVRVYQKANTYERYGLSESGKHTLEWAGAPKPEHLAERGARGWAGQLAFAIAARYGVSTHEMLRSGTFGAPVRARGRLCAALHARGWGLRVIEDYLWIPRGWAERGVARWHGGLR